MFCRYCGRKLEEGEVCYCQEKNVTVKQPKKQKKRNRKRFVLWAVIVPLIVILIVGFAVLIFWWRENASIVNKDSMSTEESAVSNTETDTESEYVNSTESESVAEESNMLTEESELDTEQKQTETETDILEETEATEKSTNEPETEAVVIDVENEILPIREQYNNIVANMVGEKYSEVALHDGIVAYCDESELKAITVPLGVDSIEYRRFYYYSNGKLIFSYYENEDTHRFYFKEDKLIRWRYSKDAAEVNEAINHDLEYSEEYFSWSKIVQDESDLLKMELGNGSVPQFDMGNVESISATSALSEYGMTHSANRVADGDASTAWVEGADGQGIGESITFQFSGYHLVWGMRINAGYQKSSDLYQKNSRPKKLKVSYSDGISESYDLQDINDIQEIKFRSTTLTDSITVTIESVYEGTKYEDVSISEISFF